MRLSEDPDLRKRSDPAALVGPVCGAGAAEASKEEEEEDMAHCSAAAAPPPCCDASATAAALSVFFWVSAVLAGLGART